MSGPWPARLACAVLLLFPCAARALLPGFSSPSVGARVEAGTTLIVEWTPGAASDRLFDEAELVLSLDGGRTFPVRVTRDLAPRTRRILWRVPAFPTNRARLALRTGDGELASSESLRLVGAEFAILAPPAPLFEDIFLVRGEWRTADAMTGEGEPLIPGSSRLAAHEKMGRPPAPFPATPSRTKLLKPAPPSGKIAGALSSDPPETRSSPPSPRLPVTIPRRE